MNSTKYEIIDLSAGEILFRTYLVCVDTTFTENHLSAFVEIVYIKDNERITSTLILNFAGLLRFSNIYSIYTPIQKQS